MVEGKIRFGLNAVKNVGDSAARAIIAAREEGGPFESIWDFTERVDPQVANRRALEALIRCGALDSTRATRKGMLDVLDSALAWGGREQADRIAGQGSIFDLGDAAGTGGAAPPPAGPARGVREERAPRASRRRRSACTSPSIRCPRSASSCGARSTARRSSSSAAGTARS